MDLKKELIAIAKAAQQASRQALFISTDTKNKVLGEIASALDKGKDLILKANKKDLLNAKRANLATSLIDRLTLNEKRIKDMCDSLVEISRLSDPVGEVIKAWRRPNGLWIQKIRMPIGVIAIIYEARPNVTVDCVGLCFKSANAVILRGGREALNSNLSIYNIIKNVFKKADIAPAMVNMITTTERQAIDELLKLKDYIDLVMPRGGEGLIKKVLKVSKIQVLKHYKGICHVYVDKYADLAMAENICFNAKVQRPGVCNAMESLLVHKDIAARFLTSMLKRFKAAGVEIRGCSLSRQIAKGIDIKKADEKDYRTEYLDLILSLKIVDGLNEAIEHINTCGSHHSDSIVTKDKKVALKFLRSVDSACVYANASTRFTDGGQFGMGAEIGISTDKLHARGPVGLEELTTYKYMIFGNGQLRQ